MARSNFSFDKRRKELEKKKKKEAKALAKAERKAALEAGDPLPEPVIIIDEFGPLELAGGGWRRNVDSLLRSTGALILLVVRDELLETVENIYQDIPARVLAALEPSSAAEVVQMLIQIRQQRQ